MTKTNSKTTETQTPHLHNVSAFISARHARIDLVDGQRRIFVVHDSAEVLDGAVRVMERDAEIARHRRIEMIQVPLHRDGNWLAGVERSDLAVAAVDTAARASRQRARRRASRVQSRVADGAADLIRRQQAHVAARNAQQRRQHQQRNSRRERHFNTNKRKKAN